MILLPTNVSLGGGVGQNYIIYSIDYAQIT